MSIPSLTPVLVPVSTLSEHQAALEAHDNRQVIVTNHYKDTAVAQYALQVRQAEAPFLYGQDFEITPEDWDQDYGDLW